MIIIMVISLKMYLEMKQINTVHIWLPLSQSVGDRCCQSTVNVLSCFQLDLFNRREKFQFGGTKS